MNNNHTPHLNHFHSFNNNTNTTANAISNVAIHLANHINQNLNQTHNQTINNTHINNLTSNLFYNEDPPKDFLFYLSAVIGWIYFAAWSISFYGQVFENFKNKSVKGLSFDYQIYNFCGFLGYTIYTVWGFIDADIGAGKVAIQDVVFATHALCLTMVTISQCLYYYDKDDEAQKVSHLCISIVVCIAWGFFNIILIEQILGLYDPKDKTGKSFRFNSVIYLGWIKAFISLIKYIPQVLMNYRRKSTKGWSIHNIVLDFTGGSFSLVQNLIDTIRGQSVISPGDTYTLNIAKYAISIISIFFDIVFIIQHYCIYNKKEEDKFDHLINSDNYPSTKQI